MRSQRGVAATWSWLSSRTPQVAFSALMFGACPGPGGGDAAVDSAVDASDAQINSCANDEALDDQYDKAMQIDCAAVRAAIDARRSPEEQARIATMVATMRRNLPRCCVSRPQLVDFMRPPSTLQQLPAEEQVRYDRAVGMMLCDPLTREVQTRSFVARNVSCLGGEQPPTDVLPGSVGGVR